MTDGQRANEVRFWMIVSAIWRYEETDYWRGVLLFLWEMGYE